MFPKLKFYIFIFGISLFVSTQSFTQVIKNSIEFEGRMRDYIVFLPTNYEDVESMPLVLNLHGNYRGFDGKWQMDWTLMNEVADTAGFIVVYPTGIYRDPSDGGWYNGAWYYDYVDDPSNGIGFINTLLDTLENNYRINSDQIYVCGHSGGGLMSSKLACELNHRIAAIASEGGGITPKVAQRIDFKRPMPFLSIHGTADPLVPYDGEPGIHSAEETVRFWTDLNICSKADTISLPDLNPSDGCTVEKITYTNNGANINVVFYKVINGGHTWPGSSRDIPSVGNTNRDISASEEIWNFFKHYELSHLSFPQHDITVRSFPERIGVVPIFANNVKPSVEIQNGGLNNEFDVAITCEIDSSGTMIYTDTQVIDTLYSLKKREVLFCNWHTFDSHTYDITCYTQLIGDDNLSNDTLSSTIITSNLIDDFESGFDKWYSDVGWGVRWGYGHSGRQCLWNRFVRNYKDTTESHVTCHFNFDFSKLEDAYLSYWTKHRFFDNDSGYVEVSADNGRNWHPIGEALTGTQTNFIEKKISLINYCGTGFENIMIRFTTINDPSNQFPDWYIDDVSIYPYGVTKIVDKETINLTLRYILFDNYPNPFNPETSISYQLPAPCNVTLRIMNILGQEVVRLVEKQQEPGHYVVSWTASHVSSGVYFYELTAQSGHSVKFSKINKMLLMK